MLKKTILSFLLLGCLQIVWADPWNLTSRGHRAAARHSEKQAEEIRRTHPRGPYRTTLENIHKKESDIHLALAQVGQIRNRTKLAEKRRRIQDYFRELSGLHSDGVRLALDPHSKSVHRTMARAALRAPGFGSANRLNRTGVFFPD